MSRDVQTDGAEEESGMAAEPRLPSAGCLCSESSEESAYHGDVRDEAVGEAAAGGAEVRDLAGRRVVLAARDVMADPETEWPVTRFSAFGDVRWRFELPAPSARKWSDVDFGGISDELATDLKVAALIGRHHPASRRLAPYSAASLTKSLVVLGRWMTYAGITSLAGLTEDCGTRFLHGLAQWLKEHDSGAVEPDAGGWDPRQSNEGNRSGLIGRGGSPTFHLARRCADAFFFLEESADLLRSIGVKPMTARPFTRWSHATEVARHWGELQEAAVERLPDAVVARIVDGARRMMGVPAEDVTRLVGRFADLCATGLTEREAAERLRDFRFRRIPGEARRWRRTLVSIGLNPAQAIRMLVHLIRDAGATLTLLGVGQRPAEYLGLVGGRVPRPLLTRADKNGVRRHPPGADMPACLTETASKSGFGFSIHVAGHVFKRRGGQANPAKWLVGGRVADGADPDAMVALDVVERLHAPLRRFAPEPHCQAMIVDFEGDQDGPLIMGPLTVGRLGHSMRNSYRRFADFSGLAGFEAGRDLARYRDSAGSCIAMYQMRKTYAQVLYRIDSRLLPAISRQLQHSSLRATMMSYIGNDPAYRRELDAFRSRENVLYFDRVTGASIDEARTMTPAIDRVLAMSASRGGCVDAERRDRIWSARSDEGRLFGGDWLRPRAGMWTLVAGSLSQDAGESDIREGADAGVAPVAAAGMRPGVSPIEMPFARDPNEATRDYVAERRRWIAGGGMERAAFDRSVHAARAAGLRIDENAIR